MKDQEALNREHIVLLNSQIESIESHLAESGYSRTPSSNLIISKNWSDDEWRSIEDVLDKYDRDIERIEKEGNAEEYPDMHGFESELKRLMTTDYPSVKRIILAVAAEGRFAYVSREYAKWLDNSETKSILRYLKENQCF